MAKGTINGSFSGVSTSTAYPSISWSSTANQSSNTSSVTAILYFNRPSSYQTSWNANGHTVAININGNSASANRTFDLRNTSRQEIWRRTITVAHNTDGAKSITIGASSASTGVSLGSYNFSANVSLDNIARASTMEWVAADSPHTFGKTQRFTVTTANSAYYHTVECRLNGTLLGELVKDSQGGGTKSLVMPLDWANKFPNTDKATGFSFRLITHTVKSNWSGSNLIGYKDYALETCNFPDTMVPTVKSVVITDPISGIPAKLGIADTVNLFVRGKSNIRLDVEANLAYSSPIQSWAFSCDGKAILTNNGPLNDIPLSKYNIGSGAKVIKCVMTDGRGRSVTKDITVNIADYSIPEITSVTAERVNNGTAVKFTKSAKVSSVKNGTTELNTYTATTKYKLTTATTWATAKTETNAFVTMTLDGFAVGSSYDILIELKDKLSTSSITLTVSTSKTALSVRRDTGVGVGKLHEKGALDVAGDVYINSKLLIDLIHPVGSIYESTASTSPATLFGGTWERFGNGKVLVGVDENDTDFSTANKSGGSKLSAELNSAKVSYGLTTSNLGYEDRTIIRKTAVAGSDERSANINLMQPYLTVYRWRRTA